MPRKQPFKCWKCKRVVTNWRWEGTRGYYCLACDTFNPMPDWLEPAAAEPAASPEPPAPEPKPPAVDPEPISGLIAIVETMPEFEIDHPENWAALELAKAALAGRHVWTGEPLSPPAIEPKPPAGEPVAPRLQAGEPGRCRFCGQPEPARRPGASRGYRCVHCHQVNAWAPAGAVKPPTPIEPEGPLSMAASPTGLYWPEEAKPPAEPASPPQERPTCRTCPYFLPDKEPMPGDCRKGPPDREGDWPPVLPDEWCGEHPDFPLYLASQAAQCEPAPAEPDKVPARDGRIVLRIVIQHNADR